MRVYLAGGMKDGWQDQIQASGLELFDPRKSGCTAPADYTRWDLEHVAKADVVLVYMSSSNPSGFGLSIELGYAKAIGKPVIFVDAISGDWRSRYFDMHREMADAVVPDLATALDTIAEDIAFLRDRAARTDGTPEGEGRE